MLFGKIQWASYCVCMPLKTPLPKTPSFLNVLFKSYPSLATHTRSGPLSDSGPLYSSLFVYTAFITGLPSLSTRDSNTSFNSFAICSLSDCFTDPLGYFPSIYINMEGKYPKGSVKQSEREQMAKELKEVFESLV